MAGPFGPRKQIDSRELNKQAEQARRLNNMSGGKGAAFRNTPAGVQLNDPRPVGFWAKIIDKFDPGGGNLIAYAIKEQQEDNDGNSIDAVDGIITTVDWFPAYEAMNRDVDTGTIVWVEPSRTSETYQFQMGGGGDGNGTDCTFTAVTKVCLRQDAFNLVHLYVEKTTFRKNDCGVVSRTCVVDPVDCCIPTPCGCNTQCAYQVTFLNLNLGTTIATFTHPITCSSPSLSFFDNALNLGLTVTVGMIPECAAGSVSAMGFLNIGLTGGCRIGCATSVACELNGSLTIVFGPPLPTSDCATRGITWDSIIVTNAGPCSPPPGAPGLTIPPNYLPENAFPCNGCGG